MRTADWHERKPSKRPPGRASAVLVYHAAKQYSLLFGGHAQQNPKDDSWLWNGDDWREITANPPANPSKRYSAAAAYDSARAQIVMFGGFDGTNYLDDTWLFDGTWMLADPKNKPDARQEAVMAFDPVTKMCILFGGDGSGTPLDDTWAWDGMDWTLIQLPANTPPARVQAAMATDSARKQIVLFGGQSGGASLDDTWIWDGAKKRWFQQSVSGPKARYRHAMAEHTSSAVVILFGGVSSAGNEDDTWAWDGSNWTEMMPSIKPLSRDRHTMAADSYRAETVLHAGEGAMLYDDTWVWA